MSATKEHVSRVRHFGNYGAASGGISSVLHEYAAWPWRRSELTFQNTYSDSRLPFGLSRGLFAILHSIKHRLEFDIAHVHLSQGGSFIREGSLVVACKLLGKPVVVTLHGSSFRAFATRHNKVVRAVLRRADVVIVLYPELLSIVRTLGAKHVEVVPNGVANKSGTNATHALQTTLFAGTVSVRKGIPQLLEAWQEVKERLPDARLDIYGPIVDAIPDSDESITWHGDRPRGEVLQAMGQAKLFVLPSTAEAFPMSILEAMSFALPVVSTNVAGIPSMLKADLSRQVVSASTPHELAAAILRFLQDDEQAAATGAANRRVFLEEFASNVVIGRLESIYTTLAPPPTHLATT